MAADRTTNPSEIGPDQVDDQVHANCTSTRTTSSEEKPFDQGNWSSGDDTKLALLNSACTATRMRVRGHLPRAHTREDGSVRRDENGNVMFDPMFDRRRERGAKWLDDNVLMLGQCLPSRDHHRVLLALLAMINPLDFADCRPIGTWYGEGNNVEFIPEGEDLADDECDWSVPTLCVRVADLSYNNASRFLHPSVEVVRGNTKNDALRDGRPFDDDAADELRIDEMPEEAFNDIVAWFCRVGLVHVLDADNGTRPASVNTLSMAQCTPTMKPTLLQGAPVVGVVTPTKTKRDGFTSSGAQKAETKETQGSKANLKRRNKALAKDNNLMKRARRMQEEDHADDRAQWQQEIAAKDARIAKLEAEQDNLVDAAELKAAVLAVFNHFEKRGQNTVRIDEARDAMTAAWDVSASAADDIDATRRRATR